MNFYETQEFFKKMFPDKLVTFTFDDNCIRFCEFVMTEGLPNLVHHIEYRQVKVSVDGMPDQYVPIQSHRENMTWSTYKKLIERKNEVHMHPDTIKAFAEAQADPIRQMEYEIMMKEFMLHSAMTKEAIEAKFK